MHALLISAALVLAMSDPWGIEQPEDYEPVTSSASSVVDPYGDPRFSDIDDPAQEVWLGVGPGPAISGAFSSGVVNGDFYSGPRDPSAPISDENRIPGWSYVVVQGGGISAYWVDAATAPSGKGIEWRISNAALNDEVYLQQYIHVSPRQRLKLPILRSTVSGANSISKIKIQYLKRDGTTTTGTEQVGSLDTAFLNPQDVFVLAGIPTDARFARIRIAMTASAAVTSDTVTFHEAWAGTPQISYETWTFSDINLTGTGEAEIFPVASNIAGTPAGTAYTTPDEGQSSIGWVEAISVRLSTVRTAGSVTFQLAPKTGPGPGIGFGPIATIDATDTRQAWASATLLSTTDLLAPDSLFSVNATGAGFTPTTADCFVKVRVAFVQLTTTTGGGTS